MVYFKIGSVFIGWLARALKRVCCKIVSRLIVRIWGNKGHGMKRKNWKHKSGKRSFKPLEISFSWFKVVFLMKR
ncbi:hypothetical protein VN0647_01600 [Helicobacter pylori]|nr:hypothetical protein VN0647_01600 [Helicobacter pylori]